MRKIATQKTPLQKTRGFLLASILFVTLAIAMAGDATGAADPRAVVGANSERSEGVAPTTPGGRAFELRTYTAAEGKLEALHARFREHTIGLFRKHGMEVLGFWSPVGDKAPANTLVYLLAYPSQEAREASWKAFANDPEWKKVYAESQKDGSLVAKVESVMLAPTDYSPMR
jgi:hypothetical protein